MSKESPEPIILDGREYTYNPRFNDNRTQLGSMGPEYVHISGSAEVVTVYRYYPETNILNRVDEERQSGIFRSSRSLNLLQRDLNPESLSIRKTETIGVPKKQINLEQGISTYKEQSGETGVHYGSPSIDLQLAPSFGTMWVDYTDQGVSILIQPDTRNAELEYKRTDAFVGDDFSRITRELYDMYTTNFDKVKDLFDVDPQLTRYLRTGKIEDRSSIISDLLKPDILLHLGVDHSTEQESDHYDGFINFLAKKIYVGYLRDDLQLPELKAAVEMEDLEVLAEKMGITIKGLHAQYYERIADAANVDIRVLLEPNNRRTMSFTHKKREDSEYFEDFEDSDDSDNFGDTEDDENHVDEIVNEYEFELGERISYAGEYTLAVTVREDESVELTYQDSRFDSAQTVVFPRNISVDKFYSHFTSEDPEDWKKLLDKIIV